MAPTTMVIAGMVLAIILLLYVIFLRIVAIRSLQERLSTTTSALSDLRTTEAQLQKEASNLRAKLEQSFQDPVTNTLSLKVFEDRLKQHIKESERNQTILGVILVDIDEFKLINEAWGAYASDVLLKEFAQRLEGCIRQVDSLARVGKDIFAILLTQLAKPEGAVVVAQRILQTLKESFIVDDLELFLMVEIGIAICPTDGQDADTLFHHAEEALQIAKQKGNHSYQFYQEQMHVRSQRELALHMSLSRETLFSEFIVFYQPIMNVVQESIFCMDTLLHWQHPQLGLITATDLADYAEKQRKSNMISEWLLRIACKQFLHWRSLGFVVDCIGISISISQLTNTHFIYRITQIMQDIGFNPEWLLLQIRPTEKIPLEELEKAFNMLQYIGVKIAIDHFGEDNLTLVALKKFPIQYLKLAPSFIEDVSRNSQATGLIKALIFLTTTLSLQLIVTGVESGEQIEILKEMGCELMQGQLLGAPLSPPEVEAKMVAASQE